MWCQNRSDTKQAVQVQKMARGWKLWILKVDELYYQFSENKGADQTGKLVCAFVFAYAVCWFSLKKRKLHSMGGLPLLRQDEHLSST